MSPGLSLADKDGHHPNFPLLLSDNVKNVDPARAPARVAAAAAMAVAGDCKQETALYWKQ